MKIMIPFEIKEDFIADVLSTAFNGGSNYWIEDITNLSECPKSQYFSKSVAQGDTLEILDNEDYKVHKLDKNIFAEGYRKFLTGDHVGYIVRTCRKHVGTFLIGRINCCVFAPRYIYRSSA